MHPFKWNPSKILPLPAAPRVPASVPLLWSPRCFTTPIPLAGRRPQPPGDRPAHGLAFPPDLASLLSSLAERTKCDRKNEYECQEPIPLPPTEENLPLLSWIVKQEPSWTFTKLNTNRKESETDKEAKKSLWPESLEWKQEPGGQSLYGSQRDVRKGNGALKISCPLWHFLKTEVKI